MAKKSTTVFWSHLPTCYEQLVESEFSDWSGSTPLLVFWCLSVLDGWTYRQTDRQTDNHLSGLRLSLPLSFLTCLPRLLYVDWFGVFHCSIFLNILFESQFWNIKVLSTLIWSSHTGKRSSTVLQLITKHKIISTVITPTQAATEQ